MQGVWPTGSLETFSLYSEIKWHEQITLTEVFWTEFEGGKKKEASFQQEHHVAMNLQCGGRGWGVIRSVFPQGSVAAAGRELSAQQGNGQNGRENAWENEEKMPGRVPGCQKLQSCQGKDTCLTTLSDRLIRGKPSPSPRFLLSRQELRSGGS